ncbi:hypothetical protein B0J13DRAFT_673963 [Dactylonectria estremocensis]|uniref:CCHC-type domain-containing protein n=1 Tax=Dactylonectria estremocensis TaxID=1079267 RepID=A0A9P9J6N4_9HYPO|nr:hypothetical protein B0J13DRAFT_673963 [Dactylonectria estremocensis]
MTLADDMKTVADFVRAVNACSGRTGGYGDRHDSRRNENRRCYDCGTFGHIARNCPEGRKCFDVCIPQLAQCTVKLTFLCLTSAAGLAMWPASVPSEGFVGVWGLRECEGDQRRLGETPVTPTPVSGRPGDDRPIDAHARLLLPPGSNNRETSTKDKTKRSNIRTGSRMNKSRMSDWMWNKTRSCGQTYSKFYILPLHFVQQW